MSHEPCTLSLAAQRNSHAFALSHVAGEHREGKLAMPIIVEPWLCSVTPRP